MAPTFSVLRTKDESNSKIEFIDVWTVELPIKAANNILIVLKEAIPSPDIDLQHIRRFVKPKNLPFYLQSTSSRSSSVVSSNAASSVGSRDSSGSRSNSSQSRSRSRSRSRMRRRRSSASSTMYLVVSPTASISYDELSKLLAEQHPFIEEGSTPNINKITVPSVAPMTVEQAQEWSVTYWPTIYRKMNPYGPHQAIIAREQQDMLDRPSIPDYMDMASAAGLEARQCGFGVAAGCAVIERRDDLSEHVVAIAGDARHCGLPAMDHEGNQALCSPGNVASHAVLRAIGMIARKRVRMASGTLDPSVKDKQHDVSLKPVDHVTDAPESVASTLLDYPLTKSEKVAFDQDNLVPSGYLCVKLEIYLTHEPCVMCAMAIVHSRFSRCVFAKRMPSSGGFSADSGLGYGLFWRQELNWKLLCWEYSNDEDNHEDNGLHELDEDIQV